MSRWLKTIWFGRLNWAEKKCKNHKKMVWKWTKTSMKISIDLCSKIRSEIATNMYSKIKNGPNSVINCIRWKESLLFDIKRPPFTISPRSKRKQLHWKKNSIQLVFGFGRVNISQSKSSVYVELRESHKNGASVKIGSFAEKSIGQRFVTGQNGYKRGATKNDASKGSLKRGRSVQSNSAVKAFALFMLLLW